MTDFGVQIIKPNEILYTYSSCQQISMQAGLIGYLRADMGSRGKDFYSTWFNNNNGLNTAEFKKEFDDVINYLRFYGMLKSRSEMNKYCSENTEASFEGNFATEYGFKINTENYTYLLRCNPSQSDYDLYCYCYKRDYYENHLQQAAKGIRFINSRYTELFKINDGDKIQIEYQNGEVKNFSCRYIDEYHLIVGTNLYHICEFAERMENAGNKVTPLNDEQSLIPTMQSKDRGDAR